MLASPPHPTPRLPAGLGERGVPAETIGQRAAAELLGVLASGACTDGRLQDQLISVMALAQVGRGKGRAGGRGPAGAGASHHVF